MSERGREGALTLAVDLETGPLHRMDADVLLVPFFEDERPLRGPAGFADWRLCGLLSEGLRDGALVGAAGEAALLPGGGPLRAGRVLALGLGARADFGEARLRRATAEAAGRLRALRAGVALLPLAEEATWSLAADRAAGAAVAGVAEGLADGLFALRLRLVVAEAELLPARRGLEAAAGAAPAEVSVQLLRDAAAAPGAPRAAEPRPTAAAARSRPAGRGGAP